MSRVRNMARTNHGLRWWDVDLRPFGWLVISRRSGGPLRVYWSPNGTPWHHGVRYIVGRSRRDRACVCDECSQRTPTARTAAIPKEAGS